jgi:hypothetical protein
MSSLAAFGGLALGLQAFTISEQDFADIPGILTPRWA